MYHYADPRFVRPRGWLRRQLSIQAQGLAGHLDTVWPDVADSKWIGGTRDGWERVPYWLDGFIPLAFLLGDADMTARAARYVDAILARQAPDGWICPCTEEERASYDVWAYFLIGKVLALYWEFTRREDVLDALERAMRCLDGEIASGRVRLSAWGKARWFECFIPLEVLRKERNAGYIPRLAAALRAQGTEYPALREQWKRPLNRWTQETHIVNLMMMLKYEAAQAALAGEERCACSEAESLWETLDACNGTAVGIITGDECLSGARNNQGTELCAVAELMYSCEVLYAVSGDPRWADRLERAAFNALPAALSDDMWTHQYDQMVNQIACVRFPGKSHFRTNNSEAHLFGLEPNFGCCTANFGQAWPKLALSAVLCRPGEVEIVSLLPVSVQAGALTVTVDTEYPFRREALVTVTAESPSPCRFRIRVPGWAEDAEADGFSREGAYLVCERIWSGAVSFSVRFAARPHLSCRPDGLYTAEYGALVFALPIRAEAKKYEYERNGVPRRYPYCDYELFPASEWRYGFADGTLSVIERNGSGAPFSEGASVALEANLSRVAWEYEDGYDTVAALLPASAAPLSPPEKMLLLPYGAAKLRMTEMPLCR